MKNFLFKNAAPMALLYISVLPVIGSCNSKTKPDLEAEKKAIMVLHERQRQAHMEKNVDLLLADSSSDFIEVNRGLIRTPDRKQSFERFQSYFDAVDFVKWDDITPPVFSFSDDATMATTAVSKLVIVKQKMENNRFDTTQFAWLAVYKKNNGKWYMHRIASTNK